MAKTEVTSTILSETFAFILLSSFFISSKFTCLAASRSTIVSISASSCTPFISTLAPSAIEMFMSCRMVPSPRFTFPVERSIMPSCSATSLAWAGETISGAVPISTSGIPRRSSEYITESPLSSTFCAASSSRHRTSMPTRPAFDST